MNFLINPGSGPVSGKPTKRDALSNVRAFVGELKARGCRVTSGRLIREDDGRWRTTLRQGKQEWVVSMPGVSLDIVRDGTPMMRPRLYVDGNSWWWPYAISIVMEDSK